MRDPLIRDLCASLTLGGNGFGNNPIYCPDAVADPIIIGVHPAMNRRPCH